MAVKQTMAINKLFVNDINRDSYFSPIAVAYKGHNTILNQFGIYFTFTPVNRCILGCIITPKSWNSHVGLSIRFLSWWVLFRCFAATKWQRSPIWLVRTNYQARRRYKMSIHQMQHLFIEFPYMYLINFLVNLNDRISSIFLHESLLQNKSRFKKYNAKSNIFFEMLIKYPLSVLDQLKGSVKQCVKST